MPEGRRGMVSDYFDVVPEAGFKKAREWLDRVDNSLKTADTRGRVYGAWWDTYNEQAIARCLVAVFYSLSKGKDAFPPLPILGSDDVAARVPKLTDWAVQLITGHKHSWEGCLHGPSAASGSSKECRDNHIYIGGVLHEVCTACGSQDHDSSVLYGLNLNTEGTPAGNLKRD